MGSTPTDPADAPGGTGRSVYSDYVKAELDFQQERKASLEQRGLAVITTAGALASLLFGLVAVITAAKSWALPSGARPWLGAAVALFVVSAVAALVTNAPLWYATVEAESLRDAVRKRWDDADPDAQRMVAFSRIAVFDDTKKKNDLKGKCLAAAMIAEVLAIVCVAVAVWSIVAN